MPKMGVNPEQTVAPKPVPVGMYELRLKGIIAKLSKSKKGFNYEGYLEIVNNTPENNGKFAMARMYNGFKQAMISNDFCHSLGFPLEVDGSFPGDWKLKPENESKPEDDMSRFDGAQYNGPLLGKVLKAELTIENFEGIDRNEIKQYVCKLPDCAQRFTEIKHLTDVRGKK